MSPRELDLLITQYACECVQELLNTIPTEGGLAWFHIIDRKMHRLARKLKVKAKKQRT